MGGEFQGSPSKTFRLTVPNIFVEESFTVALISVTERVWIRGGGGRNQDIPSKIFCLTVTAKFPYGNPLLHYFRVPKKFGEEGGEYQDLPSKIFCLTVPKYSVGESLDAALFSVTEKLWIRGRRGDFQDIPSKNFCLTVPKIFVGESFTVAIFSGIEKVWIRREGVSRFSIENFWSHSAETFVGEPFTVALISSSEKVWIGGGRSIKVFRRNIFVSYCRNFP